MMIPNGDLREDRFDLPPMPEAEDAAVVEVDAQLERQILRLATVRQFSRVIRRDHPGGIQTIRAMLAIRKVTKGRTRWEPRAVIDDKTQRMVVMVKYGKGDRLREFSVPLQATMNPETWTRMVKLIEAKANGD